MGKFNRLFILMSFVSTVSHAQDLTYKSNVQYGAIQKDVNKVITKRASEVYKLLNKGFKKVCRDNRSKHKNSISCKVNLRSFLEGKKQRILSTSFSKFNTKLDGVKVKLTNKINVTADATPLFSDFYANLLDKQSTSKLKEQKPFHKNIYVRHTPAGKSLYTTVCVDLPGVRLTPRVSDARISISKKIFWFLKAKANATIKVNMGRYQVKTAKVCGASKITLTKEDIANLDNLSLSKIFESSEIYISHPQLSKIKYSGIKINHVKLSGSNLLAKIGFSLFPSLKSKFSAEVRNSVKKELSKYVRRYVQVSNRSIQSGKLWGDLFKLASLSRQTRLVSSLTNVIKKGVEGSMQRGFKIERSLITNACRESFSTFEPTPFVNSLVKECDNLVKEVRVKPFSYEKTFADRGCYRKSYMVANSYTVRNNRGNKDWKRKCALTSLITIVPNEDYAESAACLVEAQKRGLNAVQIGNLCFNTVLSEIVEIDEPRIEELQSLRNQQELRAFVARNPDLDQKTILNLISLEER